MGAKQDLRGQRFTRLLVLEETDKRDSAGGIIWKCQCDCGNIVEVPARRLKIGDNKSCGCLNLELCSIRGKQRKKDLLNQRFGKLTVIEETEKRDQQSIVWKCKCDCGNIIEVPSRNLVHHLTSSCGCLTQSLGEFEIETLLKENNILYKKEFSFKDLRSAKNGILRFDFAIFNNDSSLSHLIEFDGAQHFYPANDGGWNTTENFKETVERDMLKNKYCENNNIKLIRIPYTKKNNLKIEDLL